jgi:hypothetical protein
MCPRICDKEFRKITKISKSIRYFGRENWDLTDTKQRADLLKTARRKVEKNTLWYLYRVFQD